MSARDDYPRLAGYATPGYINEVPHQSDTGKEFAAALDEIDRLRSDLAAMAEVSAASAALAMEATP